MSVTIRERYSKRIKRMTYSYELDLIVQQHRIREAKRGFKTKTEARDAGELREAEIKKKNKQGYDIQDVIIDKSIIKYTISDILDLWLASKKNNVKIKTYSFYEFMANMIKKHLGKINARKLKTENIEFSINKLIDNGVSSTTAGYYYTTLNSALNWAIIRGFLIKNPCKYMKKPKKNIVKMQVLNEEQLERFLEYIKHLTIYYPVVIAAETGMREAEICGLTWDNVNLDDKYLEVIQQLQKINKKLELVSVKTSGSRRKIILMDRTVKVLQQLKLKQEANKKYLGNNYCDKDFVICENDGRPYDPSYISRNFRRILKDTKHKVNVNNEVKELSLYEMLDIPLIRFHDLRHTHATILLKENINPKIVSERLGHADIRTTLNLYSHVLPDIQQNAIEKLNKLFPSR